MDSFSDERRTCGNCGSHLQPEHRFCPNCGTPVARELEDHPAPGNEPEIDSLVEGDHEYAPPSGSASGLDPSILETREHRTYDHQHSTYPDAGTDVPPSIAPPQATEYTTWGTAETTVQPERGNRTLWIILGIIAFIVLVCCCVLPLALLIIASVDSGFQEELQSLGSALTVG